MTDRDVRALERRALAEGSPADRLAWLVARVRSGLPRERLVVAAWAGDVAARALLGPGAPRPGVALLARDERWGKHLRNAGKSAAVTAALAAVEAAAAAVHGSPPAGRSAVDPLLAHVRAWLAIPTHHVRSAERLALKAARAAIQEDLAALPAPRARGTRNDLVVQAAVLVARAVGDVSHVFADTTRSAIVVADQALASDDPRVEDAARRAIVRWALET